MKIETRIFYRNNTAISVDFSAIEISSDGAVVLLEKIERQENTIQYFSKFIPDRRCPDKV